MNVFLYLFKVIYRNKWSLLIIPILLTSVAIYSTRNMDRQYQTDMTIYTGVISSYSSGTAESNSSQDWNVLNNSILNIINTINSKETLKKLSLRLYARLMSKGSPDTDNVYISAKHYNELLNITPKAVRKLIDKSSEEKTIENLEKYEKADRDNFVYGLINWNHPYFSYNKLREKININRVSNSDILQVSYEANDPGVAFQTLEILSKIFSQEYRELQYGNTNNVIKYFEAELARIGVELRGQEDSLTTYNVGNRVINYDKQTEAIALLDKEFELRSQEVFFLYNSSKAAITQLEAGLDANTRAIKNNSEFLQRIKQISDINYNISKIRSAGLDSISKQRAASLDVLNHDLDDKETDFREFMDQYAQQKYTKAGYPNANYVSQWVDELLKFKRAEGELKVVKDFKQELDEKYTHYSPIGSVLKRQERSINFSEQSYLSILHSLNLARLRLKSLEMNSATLKVINPPSFPLNSLVNSRRTIVGGLYFGSIIFILGVLFLLELFDRTLRDKMRTERITKAKVFGAFPKKLKGSYQEAIEKRAVHVLANQLYGHYDGQRDVNFVNVVKLSSTLDTSRITALLAEHWSESGLREKALYEGVDFQSESRAYLIDQDWLNDVRKYDIAVIQHASMAINPIPTVFLTTAMATLLVLRADSVWKTEDELLLESLLNRSAGTPVLICLTNADRTVVEEFTGMLPPYTFLRRLSYQFENFGLTSLGK